MSNQVEFEEGGSGFGFGSSGSGNFIDAKYGLSHDTEKGMVGWLLKKGIAKSPKSAQRIMVGIVIFNMVIMILALSYLL